MLYDRYVELKSSAFHYDQMMQIWDNYRQQVEAEVPQQSARFGFPRNMRQWQSDMDSTEVFFIKRFSAFNQELMEILAVGDNQLNGIEVYSNPNMGLVNIVVQVDDCVIVPIEMFDLMGRRVYVEDRFLMSGKNVIPIALDLRAGVYLIRVSNIVQRIVIQ